MNQREIQKLDVCKSMFCVACVARFLLVVGICFGFAGCSLMDTESKTRPISAKKSISAATTKSEKSDKKPAIKKSSAKEDIPTAPIGLK